jgi:Uma2 family endonuclease
MPAGTLPPSIKTLADLLDCLGGIPLDRIRFHPFPGTATVKDVDEIQRQEGKLCELVNGVLLEKVMGHNESAVAVVLAGLLNAFVIPRNLGLVTGPDGTVELAADLVRIPDVAFTSWDRLPGRRRPTAPMPRLAPNLAVEILSRGNTPQEMAAKRQDFFAAGVELVWEIDLPARSVKVYSSPTQFTLLGQADVLDGAPVLPGFALPLQQLFDELDRQG